MLGQMGLAIVSAKACVLIHQSVISSSRGDRVW